MAKRDLLGGAGIGRQQRPSYLTIDEAAEVAGLSREVIANRIATGELPHSHFSIDGVDTPLVCEHDLHVGRAAALAVQRR
jgi:hypothetical protein